MARIGAGWAHQASQSHTTLHSSPSSGWLPAHGVWAAAAALLQRTSASCARPSLATCSHEHVMVKPYVRHHEEIAAPFQGYCVPELQLCLSSHLAAACGMALAAFVCLS